MRRFADSLSRYGCRVYIPKVLQPPFEGGTDGDGLPPAFDIGARRPEFFDWVKTIPFDSFKAKVEKLIAYAKEQGATKIGLIGNCWGGWAAWKTAAMCADFTCGVIYHPSCELEGAFGGDPPEMCKTV